MKSQPVPPHEMSDMTRRLTELSRPTAREPRKISHLSRVARASLCLLVITALGGLNCLVTSSPDFAKPVRTPPFLTNLLPPPYAVSPLRSLSGAPGVYPSQTLTFEVVSEDLQSQSLQALLFVDFEGFGISDASNLLPPRIKIPPGHLNGPAREPIKADFTFPKSIRPGCHSVTLAVSHLFTQPLGSTQIEPQTDGDVALATWWYNVDDDAVPRNLLSSCVVRGSTPGDAGSDGEAGAL